MFFLDLKEFQMFGILWEISTKMLFSIVDFYDILPDLVFLDDVSFQHRINEFLFKKTSTNAYETCQEMWDD